MPNMNAILKFLDFRLLNSHFETIPYPETDKADLVENSYSLDNKFLLKLSDSEIRAVEDSNTEAKFEIFLLWESNAYSFLIEKNADSGKELPLLGEKAGFKAMIEFIQIVQVQEYNGDMDSLKNLVTSKKAGFQNIAQVASHFYLKELLQKTDFCAVRVPVDLHMKVQLDFE